MTNLIETICDNLIQIVVLIAALVLAFGFVWIIVHN